METMHSSPYVRFFFLCLFLAGIGMLVRYLPPRSGFPGEVSGKLREYGRWRPIEQATLSYGHGISVSLLQLARAYMVFANDGEIKPVTLIQRGEPVAGTRDAGWGATPVERR